MAGHNWQFSCNIIRLWMRASDSTARRGGKVDRFTRLQNHSTKDHSLRGWTDLFSHNCSAAFVIFYSFYIFFISAMTWSNYRSLFKLNNVHFPDKLKFYVIFIPWPLQNTFTPQRPQPTTKVTYKKGRPVSEIPSPATSSLVYNLSDSQRSQ